MAGVLLILAMLDSADAHADFSQCCVKAARKNFSIYATLPWDTCAVGTNVSGIWNPINPSVNATLGWCEEKCPGYQPSETSEWLHPITNWFIPYIGLLILCPPGDREPPTPSWGRIQWILQRILRWIPHHAFKAVDHVIQYAEFLGDPASAIWGAFSELAEDWSLSGLALRETGLRQELLVTAILVGQIELNEGTREGMTRSLGEKLSKKHVSHSASSSKSMDVTEIEKVVSTTSTPTEPRTKFQKDPDKEEKKWRKGLRDAIYILLDARDDFVNTILIPVILMLVVTASVFYDAYENLGDNDTAHSLAYGLLYSWLIILSVASNCYTSSLTPELLGDAIGKNFPVLSSTILSPTVLPSTTLTTVRLRDRYTNSLLWRSWMADVAITEPVQGKNRVVLKFLAGQLFGWFCVAVAASCAGLISYKTPTVGIGCRSFNHFLYAFVSLVVCLIPVLKYSVKKKIHKDILAFIYGFLVICNLIILLLGTALHLFGVFRRCWCMNLFAAKSKLVELNGNTAEAIMNANIYWLPVGYVAFTFIWVVCAAAIFEREYINFRVGLLRHRIFEDSNTGEECPWAESP
jgi:hypothetical protein